MTIASTLTAKQYTSTGVNTQFAYPNKIFAATDLVVTIFDLAGNSYPFVNFANATLGLTFSVQGVDVDTGATVVLSAAFTLNWTIDIRSLIPDVQSTSIKNQGQFLPELHEEAFDRFTRELQDLLRLTYTYGIHGPDTEATAWPALPGPTARANTLVGFDSNGLPTIAVPLVSVLTQAPFNALLVTTNEASINAALSASTSGKRTAAEIAASVNPANFSYQPYDVRRYGAVGDGATNDSAAFNTAGTIGLPIFVPDPPVSWLLNSNVTGTFQSFNYPKISGAGTISIRNLSASDQDNMETVVAALEGGTATTLATFGDSTMWGADPASLGVQVAIPPYVQLQNFVNTYMGNSACTVTNFAISGTTLQQMLAGTDGSGLTFAARVAATSAPVVYCNHGVNDAFGGSSTTAAIYRAGLVAFIRIVRAAGKIPVLVTPHPCLTIGTFGSQTRAENTARFANIMRSIAQSHGVILIDTNWVLSRIMETDNDIAQVNQWTPLNILADGVHGPQNTYIIAGNQLADAILGAQVPTLTQANQRIGASSAAARATNQTNNPCTSSRMGVVTTTGVGIGQKLMMCFRVGETGLDLSLMHPIWSGGASNIGVNLDGLAPGGATFPSGLANFSQLGTNFVANLLEDVETVIMRNISVGFHMLILTTVTSGAAGWNAIRVRAAEKPVNLGSTAVPLELRVPLLQKLEIPAGATANVIGMTDIACSRFIDQFEIEWTGQMTKNSALCIVANQGTNVGSPTPQQLLMFGLNASGFAQVWEASGVGTFTTGAFDAVDHSAASHVFRVIVSSAVPGQVSFFIDDVQIGSAITLAQSYYGGWLGAWKNLNTDVLLFTNISRVWRF